MYQELANGGPRAKSDPLPMSSSQSFCKIFPNSPHFFHLPLRWESSFPVWRFVNHVVILVTFYYAPVSVGLVGRVTRYCRHELWPCSPLPEHPAWSVSHGRHKTAVCMGMNETYVAGILGTSAEPEESCENTVNVIESLLSCLCFLSVISVSKTSFRAVSIRVSFSLLVTPCL